jgi:DNA-binding LacI/PurR family transcriptional regulator
MSVTILDVAKLAGVGVGTVSRVINGANHVSPATREKIEAAMLELRFHPNAQARNLKRGVVSTVGFFFTSGQRRLSDPFFNVLMAGMADAAGDRNFDLLVASCRNPADELTSLAKLIKSNRVGGMIITDTRVRDPRVELLQEHAFPCVVFGRVNQRASATVPCVDVDNKRGIERAVQHLFDLGHQRIGFIGLPDDLTCAQDRLAGYRAAFKAAGREVDESAVVVGGLTETAGMAAAAKLLALRSRPTAIVACSDVLAFGAMQAMEQSGLRAGKDVALIGFDDIPSAAHTNPPLTTVRQPIYNIGAQLVDILISQINHGGIGADNGNGLSTRSMSRVIEPDLILRDSARQR